MKVASAILLLAFESREHCCWSLKESTELVTICSKLYPTIFNSSLSANPLKANEVKIIAYKRLHWLMKSPSLSIVKTHLLTEAKASSLSPLSLSPLVPKKSANRFGTEPLPVLFSVSNGTDFCLFFKTGFLQLCQNYLNSFTVLRPQRDWFSYPNFL